MAHFVVNEWLLHDLSGQNASNAQREALLLIKHFADSKDTMVLVEGSPFDRKAWSLCSSNDESIRRLASVFVRLIRWDSNHCFILHPSALPPLDSQLASKVKPDDHYLVQAHLACQGSQIVTTDKPLLCVLRKHSIPAITRDDFLRLFIRIGL